MLRLASIFIAMIVVVMSANAQEVEPSSLQKEKYVLTPSPQQIYASAFVAAKIQYCVLGSGEECVSFIQNLSLPSDVMQAFKRADVKNTEACNATTLRKLMKYLPELPERLTVLACVPSLDKGSAEIVMALKASDYELQLSQVYDLLL